MGGVLASRGFTMLVLCAEEFQPPYEVPDYMRAMMLYYHGDNPFTGIKVVYAPNADDFYNPPARDRLSTAIGAARKVAAEIRQGGKVLSTCWKGVNRSGLVSCLTLHILTEMSGFQAVQTVKKGRPWALSNPQFVEALTRIPPGKASLRPLFDLGGSPV
jgi:protein-tyrosine phosphatase